MRIALALFLFLLLGSAALADEPKQPDALQAELKKLDGTWEGYVVDGKGERTDRGPVHLRLTIAAGKLSAINLGDGNKDMGGGTFKLDLAKKEMDATGVMLPGKQEKTYQGIYHVNGDTLKWCVSPRKGERPAEFQTAKGSFLLVLKRKI